MRVEVFRLSGEPVSIEVKDGGSVRDAFNAEGSGKVLGRDGTLMDAAEEMYGGIAQLGTLRVNGASATLDSPVKPGATILLIPKIEGGHR